MERPSTFVGLQKDAQGRLSGLPLVFLAGGDNEWDDSDDGFVRRFDVRQITVGCAAIGDCSNATTFIVQGLAQARQALHPNLRSVRISPRTTQLQLVWSEDLRAKRIVGITHSAPESHPYGYGFVPSIEVVTPPANGQYYLPGDAVSFRLVFKDGNGNRLMPEGMLPTYGEFMSGQAAGGLHFLDLTINPTLYYALKHREGNMLFALSVESIQHDRHLPVFHAAGHGSVTSDGRLERRRRSHPSFAHYPGWIPGSDALEHPDLRRSYARHPRRRSPRHLHGGDQGAA
jgi:hypothetical protein